MFTCASGFPPVEIHSSRNVSPVWTTCPGWYPVMMGIPGGSENIGTHRDDVMIWQRCRHYWPFVGGYHWTILALCEGNQPSITGLLWGESLVIRRIPHKGLVMWSFDAFFPTLGKLLNSQFVSDLKWHDAHLNGLVQESCNSSALAMELHLSCTNPSRWYHSNDVMRIHVQNVEIRQVRNYQ